MNSFINSVTLIADRFVSRDTQLNRLADSVLDKIVPKVTAQAGSCWYERRSCSYGCGYPCASYEELIVIEERKCNPSCGGFYAVTGGCDSYCIGPGCSAWSYHRAC